MHVILAPSAYYPHVGGIEELTRQLATTFQERGHRVSVLTNRWPPGVRSRETLDGVHVTRVSLPLPTARVEAGARFLVEAPTAAAAVVRHLRRFDPDVVHVIGAGPQSVYLSVLARLSGAPVVFTAQGELTFDAQRVFDRSITLRAGLRRILRIADAVTACSEFVLRDLLSFGDLRSRPVIVPNGVSPSDFAAPSSDGALPRATPYVLGMGRLVAQKGFDVLIEAAASELLADLNVVLAGEGPERRHLEKRARELGIAHRVSFFGAANRHEVVTLLRGARVFAFPSRGEPFGIALLEAMAAGTPSIATSAGGVVEFAHDGVNALLFPPDDVDRLATGIHRLATEEGLRRQLVRGGIRTADELSWSRIAQRYEQIYEQAHQGSDARTSLGVG